MRNFTKLTTTAFVAVVALTVTACGGASDESDSVAQSDTQTADVTPTPTQEPPKDTDGDGVPDEDDFRPKNPDVQTRDDLDTDGDGVPDFRDDFPRDPDRSEELFYPSGDPVLDGYPVLVDTAQLDSRLASWIDTPQAVAVAPGVYVAYTPAQPDLEAYLQQPNDGDCAVRDLYFPQTAGACWGGVLPGPQEPSL